MIGSGQFFIQPSEANFPSAAPGIWQSGIPTPGLTIGGVPAVAGQPTCQNLAAASPPTLLEQYEIYSYSIGWGIFLFSAGGFPGAAPVVTPQLSLLVNGDVRQISTVEPIQTVMIDASHEALASGAFSADLVNPIQLGARERLSISVALLVDQAVDSVSRFMVGTQVAAAAPLTIVPFASTVSYRVYELPGARRL